MYVLQKSFEAWDVGRMQQGTAACWLGWRNNCLPSRRALMEHDTPLASSGRLYPAFGVLVGQASVGNLPNSMPLNTISIAFSSDWLCRTVSSLIAESQGYQSTFSRISARTG
jgi:hypothetical protein